MHRCAHTQGLLARHCQFSLLFYWQSVSQPSPKVTLERGRGQDRGRSLLQGQHQWLGLCRGDPGVERDPLLLSCWIWLEIFCLVSIAQILVVRLSSAAWFTSGEAWDSAFPSLLVMGLSGAWKSCWSRLRMGQYLEHSAGAHTPGQTQGNATFLPTCSQPKLLRWFCAPWKAFFLAIFFCISLARNL